MMHRLLMLPSALLFGVLLLGSQLIVPVAGAQTVALPQPTRVELENGVVLLLTEKADVPLIGIEAILRGGSLADPPDKAGLASLFAALIEKGAGERSATEFATTVDAVGGRLSAGADLETVSITADFLARDTDLAIELLADMIMRPALDEDELLKLQQRTINRIRSAKDSNPDALMPIYGASFLFGDHPYATSVVGDETSLAAINIRDIQAFYNRQTGADRLIISVSGDFDTAAVQTALADAFGDWRAASEEAGVIAPPEVAAGNRVLLINKPGATQSYFWLGANGVERDFERRADLNLATTLFGGRFTSMLNTALRVESGLTYGARARLRSFNTGGSFEISSYTGTENTVAAIDMALDVLARLRTEGISEEMLSSGRNYVLGQFPTNFETAAQLASLFAQMEAQGLERGYIADYGTALTAATVESVAQLIADVYPQRDDLVFVILGDAELIREPLNKYGSVTEFSITEPRFQDPGDETLVD